MSDLDQQLFDYFEGTLSPEELETLKQKFIEDPEFQTTMIDLTVTERLLKTLSEPGNHAKEIVDTIRMERQATPIAPYIRNNLERERSTFRWKKTRDVFLIAASLMVMIFGWQFIQTTSTSPLSLKVVQSIGAEWSGNHPNEKALTPGEWKLKSGILKLASADGSHFILEGPASFNISADQNWKLHSGRVYGDINEKESNIKLSTPHADFSDVGQKFAMEILENHATNVKLLEGNGYWNSEGHGGSLPTQQWVSFTKKTKGHQFQNPNFRYFSTLPLTNIKDYTVHHWSFDHVEGDTFPDRVEPLTKQAYPAVWKELQSTPTGPVRVNGQFGDAIQLNGKDQYITTDWDGISGTKARTVSFWVKVPKDFSPSEGYGLVTWGTFEPGSTFQVSINPDKRYGKDMFGRIRIGILEGELIGNTDLRDQRWHHISVVMYEGGNASTDTHLILYVDGKVEQTQGRPFPLKTITGQKESIKVQFGRNHKTSNFFRGWLDEISIVDKALEDWEVRSLMRHNRIIEDNDNLAL